MKVSKNLKKITFALLLTFCLAIFAPVASFAASYQDGTYSVPVSLSGGSMGHNDIVSPCTVTVSGGVPYATLVFKRVKAPWHAPQYEWLSTSMGTVYPSVNESNYTNTFSNVPLPSLGAVSVTTLTSAMSDQHEITYSLYFDPSSVPAIGESGSSSQSSTAANASSSDNSKSKEKSDKKGSADKDDKEKKDADKDSKDKDKKDKDKSKEDKDKKDSKSDKKKNNSTSKDKDSAEKENDESSNKTVIYAVIAVVALIVCGGSIYYLVKGAKNVDGK